MLQKLLLPFLFLAGVAWILPAMRQLRKMRGGAEREETVSVAGEPGARARARRGAARWRVPGVEAARGGWYLK